MSMKKRHIKKREGSASAKENDAISGIEGVFGGEAEKYSESTEECIKKSIRTPAFTTLLKLLLGVLIVASAVMFAASMMKYSELKEERKRLENELYDLEAEIEELQYLLDSPVDYDYIVRVAREKLNMYLPDEIVYYSDIND